MANFSVYYYPHSHSGNYITATYVNGVVQTIYDSFKNDVDPTLHELDVDVSFIKFTAHPDEGYKFVKWWYKVGSTDAESQESTDETLAYYPSSDSPTIYIEAYYEPVFTYSATQIETSSDGYPQAEFSWALGGASNCEYAVYVYDENTGDWVNKQSGSMTENPCSTTLMFNHFKTYKCLLWVKYSETEEYEYEFEVELKSTGGDISESVDSGTCGDNLTWILYSDGELVISGTGEMWDYSDSNPPWYPSYDSDIKTVTISDSVTYIGDYAFAYCYNITSVNISDSVVSIGLYAFDSCESLTSIIIPDSVTVIHSSAFAWCTSLTSATIPNSVTDMWTRVFYGCTSLTSVTIGNGLDTIRSETFRSCTSLTSVTIPDSVIRIGDEAFYACTSLESVAIPDSVTSIGDEAFRGCTNLTSITIPDSVTSIGYYAFGYETNYILVDGFTIRGYTGSAAETYANYHNIPFVVLDRLWEWTQIYDLSTGGTGTICANAYIPVEDGALRPVTATEWNNFVAKVNEVTGSSLTTVSRGGDFVTAYKAVVTAIKNTGYGTSLPTTYPVVLNAQLFIDLANALNEIIG